MVTAQKITANTSFFMLSLIFQKILSFVYFTILARSLGVEATGQYFFAISFATMFSVFIDLGLSPVLIREVAKSEEGGDRWFQQIFSLKVLMAIFTALFLLALDNILFYGDAVQNLIYISTLIIVVDSFTLLFYAYIRGRQSLKFESLGTIIFQIIMLVVGLLVLQITDKVIVFLLVLLLASLFNFVFSMFILQIKYKLGFKLVFDKNFIREIINISWPFALSAIFAKIYAYIDTFFLKIFLGDADVGLYSVAYKITFALQFIPLAFVAALYPAFSRYFKDNSGNLEKTFIKAFHYLAFISLPISLGIIALAPEIIHQVYTSEFNFSVWPLQVLIAAIPFLFVNFSLSSFLNATNRQKINTRNLGWTMILNVVLNIIMIPSLGVWGASLASSLSTLFLFFCNLQAVLAHIHLPMSAFQPLLKSILAALLMLLAVLIAKAFVPWYGAALLGFVVYIIVMIITRTLSQADILFVKQSITKAQ